jgi:hypothetical protein
MVLATPVVTACPITPGRPHQTAAPTTIALPRRKSPIPSRRRAGSTSFTPGPIRRTALPRAWARPVTIAAIPSNSRSNGVRRGRRLPELRLRDRLPGAVALAVAVREDLLLPVDRGLARWDDPDLVRGRGGEDARVAMLGRLQDQWPDGGVTRRSERDRRGGAATATDGLSDRYRCQGRSLRRWLR